MTRARVFLLVVAAVFLPLFALPLLVAPYEWADAFGWPSEPETDVGRYFGRCLGAVAVALAGAALLASRAPQRHRPLFDLLAAAAFLLALVHLIGLVEDSQPLVEHLETGGYAAFGMLALWAKPRSAEP